MLFPVAYNPPLQDATPIIEVVHQAVDIYAIPYELPAFVVASTPSEMSMIADIQRWTTWSDRRLGAAIGTTHPTIATVRLGNATFRVRNPTFRPRLRDLHEALLRIANAATREPARVQVALTTAVDNQTAEEALRDGRFAEGLRLALSVLRPRPTVVQSRASAPARGRIVALDDDEGD